ncbi:hypothetical protein [Microcystis sp. M087S2]|uniref:hypothetical protein n=1 Tax=Microcystis sp. M087S2 TaxID=2771176 RepID=UPI0025826394|nr:hypothetical protein [Microcystis sp. M087S2]
MIRISTGTPIALIARIALHLSYSDLTTPIDILAAVKRTAIPHHATFLGWSRQRG